MGKLKFFQYNVALGTMDDIKGISNRNICQEVKTKSLQSRIRLIKLILFYESGKSETPVYLFDLILSCNRV